MISTQVLAWLSGVKTRAPKYPRYPVRLTATGPFVFDATPVVGGFGAVAKLSRCELAGSLKPLGHLRGLRVSSGVGRRPSTPVEE